jgi:putative ABC transport system permease protein
MTGGAPFVPLFTFRIAAHALLRNKTRSVLTALGIIIGVAAVIAMMATGEGAKKRIEEQFSSMGTNLLIVLPGSVTTNGARGGSGSMPSLTWDDLESIQTQLPSVRAAAPSLRTAATVVTEDLSWTTAVYGTTPEYFQVRSWPVASGSPIQPSDVDVGAKVVVLGRTVVEQLYGPSADPVGLSVRIKNIPYRVIGVAASKGQSAQGRDYDDAVFVPSTTFMAMVQGGLQAYINGQIIVAATSPATVAKAEQDLIDLLRQRHHIRPGAEDDFNVRNLAEIAHAEEQGTRTMTTLLAAVAAVSLVVGGIGIMNIMLVSVTERTHEIGLRMAVGARARDILAQFLIEALSLSVSGGLLGVILGVGVARWLAQRFGWPIVIRVDIVVVSVLFSLLVGVVFGLYPARKAARMDPIAALRAE